MEKNLNLEFRGEGNCAIVFADPQTNQVYRLVKYNATRKIRKLFENDLTSGIHNDVKNIQNAVKSELDSVVSYITNIMRPLLTEQYVVIPVLASIPIGFGENAVALAGQARPAHRKNSQRDTIDPDILYALVLPDCCFVHHSDSSISKKKSSSSSIEMGDSFESAGHADLDITAADCHRINRSDSSCSIDSKGSASDPVDESMEAHISASAYDTEPYTNKLPSYIISSGERGSSPTHICVTPHSRIKVSDNIYKNLEGYLKQERSREDHLKIKEDNGQFTLSIEIKPKKAFMTRVRTSSPEISQVCRFCMHQHLKRKSGMWPQTSSYCPLDLFSGNKQRMKHALFSLIKTPQNNLKICKNGREVYGSDIRTDLSSILKEWFPVNPGRRQKLISVLLDLVIEILLNTSDEATSKDELASLAHLPQQHMRGSVQKCDSSSFVHNIEDTPHGLPQGCVLERIYSIQSLDDLDIDGVFPLYTRLTARLEQEPHLGNKWCLNGPYNDLAWLSGGKGEQLDDLDPDSDDYAALKVKRFLVSKTLQDCSIIVAVKPVLKGSLYKKESVLRFEGDLYEFSINVIDLDPKPFEKVKTYCRQASDIAATFAETTFKTSH